MSNLKNNTAQLNALLQYIQEDLPEPGPDLPELTNEGSASDLRQGKELIDGDGNKITGTMPNGSATTPVTTITANPTLSNTYTNGSGYKITVSSSKSITPSVTAGYVAAGTAGTVTVSGSAYVTQSTIGSETTSTTAAATKTIGYGKQVTVSSGYYPSARIIRNSVGAGSAKTPATTITKNPTISVAADGKITASVSGTQSIIPSVTAGYVASGTAGTVTVTGSSTHQLTVTAGTAITPTKATQTAVSAGRYTTGAVTVAPIPAQYITTTDANATSAHILSGKTAYVNGAKVTGNIATKTSSNITVSGPTVTVPSGYYATSTSKSIGNATVNVTGTVTMSGSVTPGAVTLASNTTSVTGKTRIASTPTTSTSSLPSYYIAVKPSVAAGSGTISASGTATANPTTAGYFSTATTGAVSGSGSISSTAKAGSVYYLPIATETKTVTPTTATQNISPSSGKLLSKVTVNAMPVGSATIQEDIYNLDTTTITLNESTDFVSARVNENISITPYIETSGYISEGTEGFIEVDGSATYQLPEYYLARSARTEVDNQAQQISDIIELLETKLTNDPALVERDYLVLNIDYNYAPDGTVKLSWNRYAGASTYSITVINGTQLELARDITSLAYTLTESDIYKIGEMNRTASDASQTVLTVSAHDANGNMIAGSLGVYIRQRHLAPTITYDSASRAKLTILGVTSLDKTRGCRCYYTIKKAATGAITQHTVTDTSYITCMLGDQITAWIFQPGYLNSPTTHYLHDPSAPVYS